MTLVTTLLPFPRWPVGLDEGAVEADSKTTKGGRGGDDALTSRPTVLLRAESSRDRKLI